MDLDTKKIINYSNNKYYYFFLLIFRQFKIFNLYIKIYSMSFAQLLQEKLGTHKAEEVNKK